MKESKDRSNAEAKLIDAMIDGLKELKDKALQLQPAKTIKKLRVSEDGKLLIE